MRDEPLARHVITENARVRAAVEVLEAPDLVRLGELFTESHASLRDDYLVSTPELDGLVTALEQAGAFGARLTGAGFGGCVAAVGPPEDLPQIGAAASERYRTKTGLEPTFFVCRPAPGAGGRWES